MLNRLSKIISLAVLILPSVAFADSNVDALISAAFTWLSALVYIVIGIAVILFFWGVIKYVIVGSANEEGRRDARNLIVYGIIGLFIMVAIWGLVYFLASVLGVGVGGTPAMPALPGSELAPTTTAGSQLLDIISKLGGWLAKLVTLLIGFALVAFLWGVTKYIASGADEEKRTEARSLIVYGVLGLFTMVAVWGLVYFVGSTIGIDLNNKASTTITVPQIGSSGIEILKAANGNPAVSITGTEMTSCEDWSTGARSFKAFICLILKILNPIPPILLALAVIYFFWGIAKYMNSGGNAEELREGRNTIIYGVLGLFVIIALWGLVLLVKNELRIS
jgi:hypothetical protein